MTHPDEVKGVRIEVALGVDPAAILANAFTVRDEANIMRSNGQRGWVKVLKRHGLMSYRVNIEIQYRKWYGKHVYNKPSLSSRLIKPLEEPEHLCAFIRQLKAEL